jgi:hypothetical protein
MSAPTLHKVGKRRRRRLPLPFGGDEQATGRIPFASLAMQAVPRRRSGRGAYPPAARSRRLFTAARHPAAQIAHSALFLRNTFFHQQAKYLRQVRVQCGLTT